MPCWVGKKARKVYSGDIEGFKLANEASDLPCQEKVNGLCCWKVGLKCLIQTIKFDQRILVASYMWWHLQWPFIRPYLSNIFIITSCTHSYTGFPDLPCQEKVNGLCCWKVGLKCLIQTIKFDQRILVASYMWLDPT